METSRSDHHPSRAAVSRKRRHAPVDAFHALEAGNAVSVNVTVTPGAKPSLKISGDDNLLPFFESFVRDGKLIIRLKENSSISTKLPVLAEVVVGEIDGVEATEAANVKVKGGVKVNRLYRPCQQRGTGLRRRGRIVTSRRQRDRCLSRHALGVRNLTESRSIRRESGQGPSIEREDAYVSISGASSVVLRQTRASPATFPAPRNSNCMAVLRRKPSRLGRLQMIEKAPRRRSENRSGRRRPASGIVLTGGSVANPMKLAGLVVAVKCLVTVAVGTGAMADPPKEVPKEVRTL